jgi:hypothetical protein
VCGAAALALGIAHLVAVISHALHTGAAYDFRLYSLGVLGFLLVVPGAVCVRHARGLAKRRRAAWNGAMVSSLVLLAASGPLVPLQPIAMIPGGLALVNVVALLVSRRDILAGRR